MLWAWERRENLSFIDPQKVGVAYLAGTLHLNGDRVVMLPRLQPLIVPRDTVVVAVVRIEADRLPAPTMSSRQRADAARAIARMADHSPAAIQIDFDATRSQRAFYRDLLVDLRSRLPPAMPLSITALASWCVYDDWIADLPVDEAVPMLFRMGADSAAIGEPTFSRPTPGRASPRRRRLRRLRSENRGRLRRVDRALCVITSRADRLGQRLLPAQRDVRFSKPT
jgi:hypothetical protein